MGAETGAYLRLGCKGIYKWRPTKYPDIWTMDFEVFCLFLMHFYIA